MLGDFNLFDVVLGCVGLYTLKRLYYSSCAEGRPPLPPGPKPKLIIGNLLDMPPAGQLEWLHWAKHKHLYGESHVTLADAIYLLYILSGPISCLSIMGQHIIILNDLQVANELLEKKSSTSSNRPSSVFGGIMYVTCVINPLWSNVRAAQVRLGELTSHDILWRAVPYD